MKKTLYLHIGLHKTGTTSIQKALVDNLNTLSLHGYTPFTKQIRKTKKLTACSNFLFQQRENIQKGLFVDNKKELEYEISKFDTNVIISAESMSFIFCQNELMELKNIFSKYFEQIKIIVYLRRQDIQVVSHKSESSKGWKIDTSFFEKSISTALPLYQEYLNQYLDYNRKVSLWADVFHKENIIIRNYEKLYKNDVIADFFQIFNIGDIESCHYNRSQGLKATKIGYLMNEFEIHPFSHIRKNLTQSIDNDRLKMLPSANEAKNFYDNFQKSNIELNQAYNISKENEAIFNNDFSMYPERPRQLWDEKSANEAICSIIKKANDTYGSIDFKLLFDSAVALEKIDIYTSIELMKIIHQVLPNKKVVNDKLVQYNNIVTNNPTMLHHYGGKTI